MLNFRVEYETETVEADSLISPIGDQIGTFSHRMNLDQELEYSPYSATLTDKQRKAKAEAESVWDSAMPGLNW